MPFQPVPNTIQVNVRATLHAEPIENVLMFNTIPSAAPTPTEVEEIVNRVLESWVDNMLPVQSSGYVLTSVLGTSLHSFGGATFESSAGLPAPGAVGGEGLAGSIALVVTHRTGFSGRNFRGRTYLGGLSESDVQGNLVISSIVTAWQSAWNAFIAQVKLSDYNFMVVTRWFEGALRDEGLATIVTSSTIRNRRVDSQRRRLPKQ